MSEPSTPADDELTFAAHDLGRPGANRASHAGAELGFEESPRPSGPAADAPDERPADGETATIAATSPPLAASVRPTSFVISDPSAVTPMAARSAGPSGVAIPATATPASPAAPPLRDFVVTSAPTVAPAGSEPPWMVRDPEPQPGSPAHRGWTTRRSGDVESATRAAMRVLRDEAVHVTWKAAWMAVSAADDKLTRARVA